MRLNILSQRGFSLAEIMVAMGLMGGVTLITMKLIDEQVSNEAWLKAQAEVNNTAILIRRSLANREQCGNMLNNKAIGSSILSLSATIHREGGSSIVKTYLESDKNYAHFFIPPNGIRLADSVFGDSFADIEIDFQIKKRTLVDRISSSPDSTISKKIPVLVTKEGNIVQACESFLSDENATAKELMCRQLENEVGGVHKGLARWENGVCKLNTLSCPYGKVPGSLNDGVSGTADLGAINCVDIEDRMTLEELFDVTTTTDCTGKDKVFITTGGGGKLVINCTL